MKKNPYWGRKYIRPQDTKFRRPGDLTHGIYGSLSKKIFFKIDRFEKKRGGYSALPIYFTEHFRGLNTRENQSCIRVSGFDLTTVDRLCEFVSVRCWPLQEMSLITAVNFLLLISTHSATKRYNWRCRWLTKKDTKTDRRCNRQTFHRNLYCCTVHF